jgi:hypothetical protein
MAKVDVKQIVGIAKKNWVSLAAAVFAVAAVVVPFVVADPMVAQVQTELDQRASVAHQLETVGSKQRKMPLLDPLATEAQPLGVFPTKAVIESGQKAVDQLQGESKRMLEEALRLNVHRPLVPEVFTARPGGEYQSACFTFSRRYGEVMPAGLNAAVNGGIPYTLAEVTQRVADEKARILREKSIRSGGTVINEQEVNKLQAAAEQEIPLQMRNEVAGKYTVYVNLDTWTDIPAMKTLQTAAPPDQVWYTQLGLWIQQDVADIVTKANAGSTSIYSSPVKHVVKVYVPERPYNTAAPTGGGDAGGGGFGGGATGGADAPQTGMNPESAITLNRAQTLTGRASNGLYDVIHYSMVVRVRDSFVPQFLAEVSKGRLHYVLNVSKLTAVDSPSAAAEGYVYGNDRVVELTLECEALQLRSWTAALMPKEVKYKLGIEQRPAAAPAP